MDQNSQNNALINNSRIAWPTSILMPFLNFLDNLLLEAYIIFHKDVDDFQIEHKICKSVFFSGVQYPL